MPSQLDLATILVVEGDVVLGKVLSRVLAREGLNIVHAVNAAQALELAKEHSPQLALIEWSGREGRREQGLEIAAELHTRYPGLPLIGITDRPLDGEKDPRWLACFARILPKGVNLRDLRQAVKAVLDGVGARPPAVCENAVPAGASFSPQPQVPVPARQLARVKELPMRVSLVRSFRAIGLIALTLVVLTGFAIAMGAVRVPWQPPARGEAPAAADNRAELGVVLVPGQPHTLAVPEDVRKALGITTRKGDMIAVAMKPTRLRPLVMPGSTALDPTRLFRVRARFAPSPSSAEVVEIAQVPEDPSHAGQTEAVSGRKREIRSGDWVRKGQVLAVFYSVDVGNKKNDLIDAMYQLALDEQIFKAAEAKSEVVPAVFLWTAERNAVGDANAVSRAVSTLRTWGIPEEDIQAVRDEAEKVKKRRGKHDTEKDALWARVELRAPSDGVIVERNVALGEIVVDNTTNLFQIAKVDRLSVFANVPEDDLPALEALPAGLRRWTVKTVGSDPIPGFIDDISYIIDPNQHTAVVKGHIDNKQGKLRAGQFISATVELPPPPDVVEVPADAVADDGQQSVIFVQTDPVNHYYTMRRVELSHRFDKTVFVRSKPFAEGEQHMPEEEDGMLPKEPLRPGERILQTGVGELKAALLDKESQPENKANGKTQ